MPAAVKTYAETKDYVRTSDVLKDIVTILKKDTGKYSRKAGRVKINSCLDSILSSIIISLHLQMVICKAP